MLATGYAKALDAELEKPILGDRFAKEIVDRIDYDWKRTAVTPANSPTSPTCGSRPAQTFVKRRAQECSG